MKLSNLKRIPTYAALCGVSETAIKDRLKLNTLSVILIDDVRFIDIALNPPGIRTAGRHKKPGN